jgi:hypothetical protein
MRAVSGAVLLILLVVLVTTSPAGAATIVFFVLLGVAIDAAEEEVMTEGHPRDAQVGMRSEDDVTVERRLSRGHHLVRE